MNKTYKTSGFTLLELLITIAIAGLLVAIAAPNLSDILDDNVTTTQTNHFATAINVARSEAVKRNERVVICKRAGNACDDSADWQDGWIVFVDLNGDNIVDAGEEISFIDALREGYSLTPEPSGINLLAFEASGKASSNLSGTFTGAAFSLCPRDQDIASAKLLTMNAVGRTRIATGVTACPD